MIYKSFSSSKYEYDIALSFADENRDYVEAVANILKEQGIKVFYDKFEESSIWGKDLYKYLNEIFRSKAQYCVLFISKYYAIKKWTNIEKDSVQARAFKENIEYLLPVRFDDTEIDGINDTIGYIDLRKKDPKQLADLIIKKLHLRNEKEMDISRKFDENINEVSGEISILLGRKMGDKRIDRLFEHLSSELEGKNKQEIIYHLLSKANNLDVFIKRLQAIINVHHKSYNDKFKDNFNSILTKLDLKLDDSFNIVESI